MNNDYPRIPLGSIIEFHRGYDLPEYKRESGCFPVFSSAGITGHHNKYKVDGENVITGRYGTIGKVYYYDGKCWPHNTALYVSDFKRNVPLYIFFLLQHALNVDGNDKSTVPGVNRNDLYYLKVPFQDDKNIQLQLTRILSLLDRKIALNNAINAELEKTAKLLYDYWFVQFDFPGANGKPYRSSGGAMEYNEQLKRKIPKGWRVKTLSGVVDNITEGTKPGEHLRGLFYTPLDIIPMRRMSFYGGQSYEDANSSLMLYRKNDILLGAMRVHFHRVCISAQDGITRSTTIVMRPKIPDIMPFLYQVLNSNETIEFAVRQSGKSQQPYVNWESELEKYSFAMPPETLVRQYSRKVRPVIAEVILHEHENHELVSLRDFLLPLLMNGQVMVTTNTY